MSHPSASRRRHRRGTLVLEILEDRSLPSTNPFSQSVLVERPSAEPAPQERPADSGNTTETTSTAPQENTALNETTKPTVKEVAPADTTRKDLGTRPDTTNTDSTPVHKPVAVSVREVVPRPTPSGDPGPAAEQAPNVPPGETGPAADATVHQRSATPAPVVPLPPPPEAPLPQGRVERLHTPPAGATAVQATTATTPAVAAEAGAGRTDSSETAAGVGVRGEGSEQTEEAAPAPAVPALYEREVAEEAPAEPGLAELAGAVLPFDRAALDAALQQFLGTLEGAGQAVGESFGGLGPAPWLAAVAAGVVAYEVARRRAQGRRLAFLAPTLFPGLKS
jgi:hypothetical protein